MLRRDEIAQERSDSLSVCSQRDPVALSPLVIPPCLVVATFPSLPDVDF